MEGHAVVVPGLYEAEVPVSDQSITNRKRGIAAALRSVLVKLTGDRNVSGRNAVDYIVERVENYVQKFEYRTKEVESGDHLPAEKQLLLWVKFNEDALNSTLREYNIPVWGKERPTTLVWLATQDNKPRRLIAFDDPSGYLDVLEQSAMRRGIALVFPLMDLEDTFQIKASDIWGGFHGPVLEASERYGADAILTGSIEPILESLWEARWSVTLNNQTMTWSTQGELPGIILDEGIDGLADILAQHYAQAGGNAYRSEVEIIIEGINDYEHYVKAMQYLASLNSVTNVQTRTAEYNRVTFLVTALGGESAITQAINLGKVLESTAGTGNTYRLFR